MEYIARDLTELVGHTPLLEASRFCAARGLCCRLLCKLESLNPAGSVKDRVALAMLRQAEREGKLSPGATIIEPTSGNTGIGLAAMGAVLGYRVLLTMPETMSQERRALLKAYGAQLVLTEGSKGMAGAIEKARELAAQLPGSFIPGQFENPANPQAHYDTTGPELWEQTGGVLDIFVAGTGTGGTLTGTGRFLREKKPDIQLIAVEPAGSPVLTQGKAGPHGLQGMWAGFVPQVIAPSILVKCWPAQRSRPMPPPGSSPAPRASWWASPPGRPCGRPARWGAARRTRVSLWPCSCRTRGTGTSPHLCLRRMGKNKKSGPSAGDASGGAAARRR